MFIYKTEVFMVSIVKKFLVEMPEKNKGVSKMNVIANAKEKKLLDYLCNGLENSPDTSTARCKQQVGLEVFKETMRLHTVRTMQDIQLMKVYENSFSRCRSRFDEFSRVSLGARERR